MKNLNLAPPSHKPVKGIRGNKPLIFVLFFLLLLLSFIYFHRFIPLGRQWQDKFVTKIGSLLGAEKSRKSEKISISKRSPAREKGFRHKSEQQEAVVNIDRVGMGKGEVISEEKNKEAVGIEINGNEALIKAGSDIVVEVIEEKPVPAGVDEKVVPGDMEKEPVLAKAETRKEGGEEEKIEELESSSDTTSYYIQVCSCVIKENADKIFKKLADQDYLPIMKEIVSQVNMHNIYTGDFEKKSEAVRLLDRLKSDGFDSVLLPSSGGRYKLRITSCFYMESAKKVIKRLNRLGYKTSIRKELIPTKMYAVLLGNFKGLQEAEAASKELIKKGYPKPILKPDLQI